MPTRLQDEIKQTKPFASREQEASLSVQRTAALLDHATAEALKPYEITPTQYNVLRILRGAKDTGLCRSEIWERMIAQVPDVTRLLDRMEAAGLVARERSTTDRRFVTTRITEQGLELLAELDTPIEALHQRMLGHLETEELGTLIELLGRIRSGG